MVIAVFRQEVSGYLRKRTLGLQTDGFQISAFHSHVVMHEIRVVDIEIIASHAALKKGEHENLSAADLLRICQRWSSVAWIRTHSHNINWRPNVRR